MVSSSFPTRHSLRLAMPPICMCSRPTCARPSQRSLLTAGREPPTRSSMHRSPTPDVWSYRMERGWASRSMKRCWRVAASTSMVDQPKAELHALEDRQASVAIDQVDQASMVNVDVVAADALGPRRHVRQPPGGLLHRQGIGDIDHPEPVGEPGGGNLVAGDGFDGLMACRHQWRLDPVVEPGMNEVLERVS